MEIDLMKAVTFAAEKHKHQKRKGDGSSYICHPLRVAKILLDNVTPLDVEHKWKNDYVIGAILHDTVEDTDTTLDEIEEKFGKDIRNIVAEVSDDKSLPKVTRKKLQIEHIKTASIPARLIKAADKIDNLRDLLKTPPKGWDHEMIRGYFLWAREVMRQVELPACLALILRKLYDEEINGVPILSKDESINQERLNSYYQKLREGNNFWILSVRDTLEGMDYIGMGFPSKEMAQEHINVKYQSRKSMIIYPGNKAFIEGADYWKVEEEGILTKFLVLQKVKLN